MPPRKTTLKQIAQELGIHVTMVSKVLNDRMGTTGASQKTREAILKKAKELDYRPNALAVALKGGRKSVIGVFLHHTGVPSSGITDQFLRGLSSRLEKTNTRMWLRFFVRDRDFLDAFDEQLEREVDGLIIAGISHPRLIERLRAIRDAGLPVVTAFEAIDPGIRSDLVSVGTDYVMQTYLATRHLVELGCRRLGHLGSMESRHRGFTTALKDAGLGAKAGLHFPCRGFDVNEGTVLAEKLLKRGLPVDGLVCQSDAQAFGVITHLAAHGVAIPSQIKVTGVDDSPLASISPIPITSASSGMGEMGERSADLLLRWIGGESVRSLSIQPKLMVRQSTAGAIRSRKE
ncbi:MAG TPA: LacI family DNA-binding transcriptional regulator [Candidatus Methylacidiphilales bacterium]